MNMDYNLQYMNNRNINNNNNNNRDNRIYYGAHSPVRDLNLIPNYGTTLGPWGTKGYLLTVIKNTRKKHDTKMYPLTREC